MASSHSPGRYCPSCGSRLARDNTDILCTPCRNKAQEALRHPPTIPPEFWEAEELQAAFASSHMGKAIYAYRHHPFHGPSPLSQELVGGWANMTQAQLSRIENGNPIHDLRKLIYWAQTLGMPAKYLWFDLPECRRHDGQAASLTNGSCPAPGPACSTGVLVRPNGLPWVWNETQIVQALSELARTELMLNRWETVKGMVVIVGAALTQPLHRWLDPESMASLTGIRSTAGPMSEEEIELIETATRVFRNWEYQYGGGLGRKAVIGQLSEVTDLLHERHPARLKRRLFAVTAELAKTAGSMSWDAGLHASAQRYYVLAVQAAKAGGDQLLAANVLASMARQMLDLGHADDALDLIHLAQYGSRKSASARLRAMLYTREAWAYAKLGQVQAFHRAVGLAEYTFAEADTAEDPAWIAYFDAAELAGVIGARYRDLAHHDPRQARRSESRILEALQLRPVNRVRNRAFDLTGLARAYLMQGQVDGACEVAVRVLPLAKRLGSRRILDRLADLSQEAAPYSTVAVVCDLRERIADVLRVR